MSPLLLLADLAVPSADTSFIGAWVAVAVLVIGGLSTLTGLVAIFATRREVEALQERTKALEARIDSMAKEFGDAFRSTGRDIGDMKQNMPMQIVTLLRNTGALD